MAMDAVPFDLLRSSLDSLKLRFQVANDPGSPSKAWLLHVHDRGDETPAIYAQADGFNSPSVESSPSTWSHLNVPAIGRRVPRFRRVVQLKGYQRLGPICEDAARLLDGLPTEVQSRLWRGLPERTQLTIGLGLWVLVVFEFGNANVVWSPLRCNRLFPMDGEQAKTIFAPESRLSADADWYATLPDFAAASVQAIDILQSWLADLPKQTTEVGGKGGAAAGGASSTLALNAETGAADNEEIANLQPCERKAYYAANYAEGKLGRKLSAKEVWDYWREHGFDPNDRDTQNAGELAIYEVPDNFDTFKTQLSRGRSGFKDKRNEDRKGREGRSVRKRDEL